MAGPTTIQWTEHSWNPIVGCSIVSPGCRSCYAMKFAGQRLDGNPKVPHYSGTTQKSKAGPVWSGKIALAPDRVLLEPLRRKKPTTYFVNSMGDLFHEDCPDEWIDRVFAVMLMAPQHTFQVLTKRASRMREYVTAVRHGERIISRPALELCRERALERVVGGYFVLPPEPWPNVWLGVSAEDQKRAAERIPHLLATPAAVRFISAEPLLGPLDLFNLDEGVLRGLGVVESGGVTAGTADYPPEGYDDSYPGIDWVIVGGESGPGARPMHPDWARSLRDQCELAGVPFFFKQWGEWGDYTRYTHDMPSTKEDRIFTASGRTLGAGNGRDGMVEENWRDKGGAWMARIGKAKSGRLLDGVEHNGMPASSKLEGRAA